MSKQQTYTVEHERFRNQDVYDPLESGDILRVDGGGRLRGLSRAQAGALMRVTGWSMKTGSERIAFEGAFIDLMAKFTALRDFGSFVSDALREARESGANEGELQAFVFAELKRAGLPPVYLEDIDRGFVPSAGPGDWDGIEIGSQGSGEPEPTEDEGGLDEADAAFTGEIAPEALEEVLGEPAAPPVPVPAQPEPNPKPLEFTIDEGEIREAVAAMPWRAVLALAEEVGQDFSGEGATARAKDWLADQPAAKIAEAMEALKES